MANKSRFTLRLLAALVLSSGLVACTTGEVREDIERGTEIAAQGVERSRAPGRTVSYDPLVITDETWAGSKSIRLRNGQPLPERFEKPRAITVVLAEGATLGDISGIISSQTGIAVRPGAGVDGAVANRKMQLNYVGPLSGLLSQVANFYEVNWVFDGSSVSLSRFETRVFVVEALPGKTKYSDEINGDDSSSSSSSGSSGSSGTSALKQENKQESDLDFWKELTDSVNGLLGGVGRAVVAQSMGTITVTTTPEVMKQVARYMEQQNQELSRQVAVNVQVFTVDVANNDEFRVSLDSVFKRLGPLTADVASAAGPAFTLTGAGNFAVSIVDSDSFGRVDAVLNALSAVGNASRVAEFPMTTLNNRPVSRRIGVDRTYLAEVSQSVSGTSGTTTTSLTPGTIREGFTLQLTPRMMQDGRLLMQYSLSLQELLAITSFTSGANSIQLPRTSSKIFVQQSLLRSGQTLVLAGYSDDKTTQNSQGMLNPFNYLLGGGSLNSNSRQLLFLAITPQEIDTPRVE